MTDREQIQSRILDAMAELAAALNELRIAARAHAEADHAYRQAQAIAWLQLKAETAEKRTEAHYKALVDATCSDAMLCCRLAEARHESAREAVRAIQTTISAAQSILNAERAEANAVRFGQTTGA